jgi:cold shock protein
MIGHHPSRKQSWHIKIFVIRGVANSTLTRTTHNRVLSALDLGLAKRLRHPPVRQVRGLVKWFNPDKGFGFVELADGSGDAFLHGSVLAQSGINAVQPGETVEVRVGPGHKGPHITEVLSVDTSTATPTTPRQSSFRQATSSGPPSGESVEVTGAVTWFNLDKGFGFIARDDGGKDVFVHISTLERSGLPALNEGERVVADVFEGRKGLEAAKVRLA